MNQPLWTAKQVAQFLNLSERAVLRRAANGNLRVAMIDGVPLRPYRFDPSSFEVVSIQRASGSRRARSLTIDKTPLPRWEEL